MDEKNKNVSGTFGKYNNETIGQVQDVSSSNWTPISAGPVKSNQTNRTNKSSSQGNKNQSRSKKNTAKAGKSKAAGGKTPLDDLDLISRGNPSQKSKTQNKNQPKNENKKPQEKNTSSGKKNTKAEKNKKPVEKSRTPKGRDMRSQELKKQEKHEKGVEKNRQDYRDKTAEGVNHREFSEEKNKTKRKRVAINKFFTLAVVFVFTLFFAVVIFFNKAAPIENIIIDGKSIYTEEEIYEAAGIARGKNLYSFTEKKVKRDVTTKLPYIKDVKVDRENSDTIIITIIPTQDKYAIACSSGWITLDKEGKVVSTKRQTVENGVYRIDGFDYQKYKEGDYYRPEKENELRYELMKQIVTLLDDSGVVESAVINLQNTDDVFIEYGGKVAIYLGECKELDKQIPGACGILKIAIAKKATGYIDVRYSNVGSFVNGSMKIQ